MHNNLGHSPPVQDILDNLKIVHDCKSKKACSEQESSMAACTRNFITGNFLNGPYAQFWQNKRRCNKIYQALCALSFAAPDCDLLLMADKRGF